MRHRPRTRSPRRKLAYLLGGLTLAACGSAESDPESTGPGEGTGPGAGAAQVGPPAPPDERPWTPAELRAARPEGDLPERLELHDDLVVEIQSTGLGPVCEPFDNVTVHYEIFLVSTGMKFDSSRDRGQPVSSELGSQKWIPGMERSLIGLRVGTEVVIHVPSALGYGPEGSQIMGVQGDADLRLELTILHAR